MAEGHLEDVIRPEEVFALELSRATVIEVPAKRIALPADATPLIGRARELDEVCALIQDDRVRLTTLTGAGGTGKTRLAHAAASRLLPEFPDGVAFVPLAAIRDPALLPSQIAKALSLKEKPAEPLVETVKGALAAMNALLLLDNFEQLLEAAPVLSALLRAAAGVEMLVTSRFALRLSGEHEYVVPPLSVPDSAQLPSLESLEKCEAVALFLERAQATKPDFHLTDENAEAVAEICARLDGLPLALELAATRIKLLSPEALVARLEQRLPLLTGGARDLPAHQQTLRDTIAWSYELLEPSEQRLFWRLAVFSGGFTLESAEAICDPEGDLGIDVLEGVASLIDKSLLRHAQAEGEEPRFGMLSTIHEYAVERLSESGEGETIGERHAQYFLCLAEEAKEDFREGRRWVEWLARLEQEHDNLRSVYEWCFKSGRAEWALRLGVAIDRAWWISGRNGEQIQWLERAVALTDNAGSPLHESALRADVLLRLAHHFDLQQDSVRGRRYCELATTLCRKVGDENLLAYCLEHSARFEDAYERRKSLLEESLALCRKVGDAEGEQVAIGNWGYLELTRGNVVAAATLLEEALARAKEGGNQEVIALGLQNLGFVALHRGRYSEARTQLEESLTLGQKLGYQKQVAYSLLGLAAVESSGEENERAAALLGISEALIEDVGMPLEPLEQGVLEQTKERVLEHLSEERFQTAVTESHSMTLDEAIDYALARSESAPKPT